MRLLLVMFLAAQVLVMKTPASAQTTGMSNTNASLLVVNQGDATLSFVDTGSNRQIFALPENVPKMFGHEVAVSPDRRLAYLPLYGDSGVGRPGTDGDLMLVIDIPHRTIAQTLHFGHGVRPHSVIFEPKSNLIYVTTEMDHSVSVIDPTTLDIIGAIPTGQPESHMLAISHDGRRAYTANVGAGTVSVLDLNKRQLLKVIKIAPTTQRIAISNDDRTVFTSDQTSPQMAAIDTATNEIAHWITLPAPGYGSTPTKDGNLLLVTLPTANSLAVVDLKTFKTVRTIVVGPKPQEVLVRPDGGVAYVSCFGSDQVAVLDLSTWQITGRIEVGPKADGMAWAGH